MLHIMNSADLEAYKVYSQTSLCHRVLENNSSGAAEWKFIVLDKKFAVVVPARYDLEMLQIRKKTLVQRGLTRSALRKPARMPHASIERVVCKNYSIRRDLIKTTINRISTISSLSNKLFSNPHFKHINQIDCFNKITLPSFQSDAQVAAIENKSTLNKNIDINQAGSVHLPIILTNKIVEKSDEPILNIPTETASNKIVHRLGLESLPCSMNALTNSNVVTKIPSETNLQQQLDKTNQSLLNSSEESDLIDKKSYSVLSVSKRKVSAEFPLLNKSFIREQNDSPSNACSQPKYYSHKNNDIPRKHSILNLKLKTKSFDNKYISPDRELKPKQKSISNIQINQEMISDNRIILKDKKKVSFKISHHFSDKNLINSQIKREIRRATVLRSKVFNRITNLSNKFNNLNISNTHTSTLKHGVNHRQKKVKNPRLISKATKVQSEMKIVVPEVVISTPFKLKESEQNFSDKNVKITFSHLNNNQQKSPDSLLNPTTNELIEKDLLNVESNTNSIDSKKPCEKIVIDKDKVELKFESKYSFARNYFKLSELDFTKPYSFSYFELPMSYLTYNRNFIRLQKYKEVIASIRCVGSVKFLNLNLSKLKEKRIVDSIFEKIANFKQSPTTSELKLDLSANNCYYLHRHIKEIMSRLKDRPSEFKYGSFNQQYDKADLVFLNLSRFESMDLNLLCKEIDKI